MMSFALLPTDIFLRSKRSILAGGVVISMAEHLLYRNSRHFFSGVATSRPTRCLARERSTVVAFFNNSRSMLRWFVSVCRPICNVSHKLIFSDSHYANWRLSESHFHRSKICRFCVSTLARLQKYLSKTVVHISVSNSSLSVFFRIISMILLKTKWHNCSKTMTRFRLLR